MKRSTQIALRSVGLIALVLAGIVYILAGRASLPAYSQGTAQEIANKGPEAIVPVKAPAGQQVATFAAGCFWARDAIFRQVKGVSKVESGYAGGTAKNPTYEDVSTGRTGHTETVQIFFDPKVITYKQLLDIFFHTHDPTTLNRQDPDVGTQYRSAVFYHSKTQKAQVDQMVAALTKTHAFKNPIVTQVVPYTGFYDAEKYHQNFFALNPDNQYCRFVVAREVDEFQKRYHALLKPQ